MMPHPTRSILITGGTGGLGSAVTLAFLESGTRVFVPWQSEPSRDALLTTVAAHRDRLFLDRVDITHETEVKQWVDKAAAIAGGAPDALVCLAGGFAGGRPVAETDLATWERMLALNLTSVFLCARAVAPLMTARGSGKIVAVAARAGLQGAAGIAAYSVSKAGVINLVQALAEELKEANVQVNCILPSTIDTSANRRAMPGAEHDRWVAPPDIARVLLFLTSDDASVISGAAIPVYGRA
jgi:NAD(P)-dependent dehydrogenase (short-subunit alcohol dehydrogenase family)